MDPARRLTYRFFKLPFHKRVAVSSELDLIEDDDVRLSGLELGRRAFRRARERGLLEKLWDAIAAASNVADEQNPYSRKRESDDVIQSLS